MKHYLFSIVNNRIDIYMGEVSGTLPDYKHYPDRSFGEEEIYYKVTNGKVSDIICEARDQETAKEVVTEFLSDLS